MNDDHTPDEMPLEKQVEFLKSYCTQQSEHLANMAEQRAKDTKNLHKAMMKLFELSKKYNEPIFKLDSEQ